MSLKPAISSLVTAFSLSIPCLGAVSITLSATYDETGQANAVDNYASSAAAFTNFKTNVSTAYGSGFGGVITFDDPVFSADTVFNLGFASGTKTVTMTSSVPQNSTAVAGTGTVTPISGSNVMTRGTSAVSDTTFTFGQVTGAGAGTNEFVTEFAFTLLSRTAYTAAREFQATAYFSDGSSTMITAMIGTAKGTSDTFYSFIAPTGHSITSVFVDAVTQTATGTAYAPVFDDLAIITTAGVVPEPTAPALAALGSSLFFLRRRKGS